MDKRGFQHPRDDARDHHLLVGLMDIAQLVPASILMNYRNRTDSSALFLLSARWTRCFDQRLIRLHPIHGMPWETFAIFAVPPP